MRAMHQVKFYGSTVMGERGQVVIPAESREEIDIKAGEKLIVLGSKKRGFVILFKSDVMTKFASMMFRKANVYEEIFDAPTDELEDDDTDE